MQLAITCSYFCFANTPYSAEQIACSQWKFVSSLLRANRTPGRTPEDKEPNQAGIFTHVLYLGSEKSQNRTKHAEKKCLFEFDIKEICLIKALQKNFSYLHGDLFE